MDAKHSLGEPRLLISRSAWLHNARVLRRNLAPGVKLCAMVKADAYGHGASIVTDTLCNLSNVEGHEQPAAEQVAVATIDEAALLALDTAHTPIMIMRPLENVFLGRQREAIEFAIRRGCALTIMSPSAADDVARVALNTGKIANVHVMVDTGMTRCGVPVDRLEELLTRIDRLTPLRVVSLGTHFANSDVPYDRFTIDQLRMFARATNVYVIAKQNRVLRHAANTGGIFFTPQAHLNMVRPGIGLYGIDPTCKPNTDRPLRPVMRWTAPLMAIHDVRAGASIGYNQTFSAPRDMRIGLVPVGYADGYLRAFSNRAVMLVNGGECPVVGRVSMDFTTIDLTASPHAIVGDEVTVLDDDPLSPASSYELSRLADTIPYELFTRIGARVRRVGVQPEDSQIQPAEEADY
jgi:alanine racemase